MPVKTPSRWELMCLKVLVLMCLEVRSPSAEDRHGDRHWKAAGLGMGSVCVGIRVRQCEADSGRCEAGSGVRRDQE